MSHRQTAGRGPAAASQLVVGCVALCLMLAAAAQEAHEVPAADVGQAPPADSARPTAQSGSSVPMPFSRAFL